MSDLNIYEFLSNKELGAHVVATMVDSRGSAPQDVGAKIVFNEDKILFGTIGGGKVEAKVLTLGQDLLKSSEKKHHFVKWNLQKDVGMTCGGEVQIFFEIHHSRFNWNVAIFGAGHVSIELNRVLSNLSCNVSCFDSRSEWLDKVSDNSRKILTKDSLSMADEVSKLSENTFVVLMTMGHKSDLPILNEALKRKFPYLGVIGSIAKRKIIEHELKEKGTTSFDFLCPIGEKIGDNSPSEIAISIASELLKIKDKFFQTKKRN